MRLVPFLLAASSLWAAGPFLTEPYLQLGDARGLQKSKTLTLLWHTPDDSSGWTVDSRSCDQVNHAVRLRWMGGR